MPVLSGGNCASGIAAQDVIDRVATDLLQRIAPENPVLLDYINRVQLKILRLARWKFALSAPQRFVTRMNVTDYWVGPAGSAPLGTFDTGLGIINLGLIKGDTVYDRSNYRNLGRTDEEPLAQKLAFQDMSARPGRPRMWRNAPDTPNVVNIYPAPDNQNVYQPVPPAPAVLPATTAGALAAGVYYLKVALVDSLGNVSSPSEETSCYLSATGELIIQPPEEVPTADSGVKYDRYNIYISTTSQGETLQNVSPQSTSAAYVQNVALTTNGGGPPSGNSLTPMGGYLIEFRYYQAKPQVASPDDCIIVPDDYLDVLIAGVNYLVSQYIQSPNDVQYWMAEWKEGLIGMIRDRNLFPRGIDFMKPDPTSAARILPGGIEVFDESQYPTITGP